MMRPRKRAMRPTRRADDSGATLIIVLILITAIALVLGVVLSQVDTSLRTTLAVRDAAGNSYNADGAAQAAISNLRNGTGFTGTAFNNATGTTCFGPNGTSGTLNLPDFYPATNGIGAASASSASVVCRADPETGAGGTLVPINDSNRPGQAILTLGQSASEHGINVKAQAKNTKGQLIPFRVHGTIKSNSDINVQLGSMESSAAVTAHTGCVGTITSTPPPVCNAPVNDDPGYASEASFSSPANAVPSYQAVPANSAANCPGNVFAFSPGYYDDANALTSLMTGNGACAGSTWWFKPGIYYFDFHNNTNDANVYAGGPTANNSAADVWTIGTGALVAGTPIDSSGNVISSPAANPTIPGACQSPITSVNATGVQFIFGGDSQLSMSGSASGEICGTYHSDRPPLAIYGLPTGSATTTTLAGPSGATAGLKMTSVPAQPTSLFTNPANIKEQDNVAATWVKTAAKATSTVSVDGYAPPSAIPAGSIVKSATIRVRHGNSAGYTTSGSNKDVLSLAFTPAGGTAFPLTPNLNAGAGLTTDTLTLDSGGTSAFAKWVHSNGYTGGRMTYSATLSHAGTESLDSIQLDIQYVVPAFRMEQTPDIASNCMSAGYSGGGAGAAACPVISTVSSYKGAFFIQGTTYVPTAAVDLTLSIITAQVLRFGVISRTLWLTELGGLDYSGPVIEVPDNTFGSGTIVYLTVYTCPGVTTSTCSTDAGAQTALYAKVLIKDATSPPTPGNRQITVLSWSQTH